MNIIYKLFDEQFVIDLFKDKILPLYPDFTLVKKVEIHDHKKFIWEETYHVVIEFITTFVNKNGKAKKLPIYCSAHSDEPRKNVYDSLKFLWEHGFSRGYLSIPHPLFYSDYFQGTFYRGVKGRNLYQYIRERNLAEVESIVIKAAAWFAKLHSIPTKNARNFNEENSRIATVFPGIDHVLYRIKQHYPRFLNAFKQIYKIVNEQEINFLASIGKRWLVHGDAHPENIIRMSPRKIAIIDFTDLCLSDFARDLGAFLQQLEYMCNRKINSKGYAAKIKKIFLDNYLLNAKIILDEPLQKRINSYYYWTAVRSATFFLLKDKPEPERAYPIINQVCQDLNIKID